MNLRPLAVVFSAALVATAAPGFAQARDARITAAATAAVATTMAGMAIIGAVRADTADLASHWASACWVQPSRHPTLRRVTTARPTRPRIRPMRPHIQPMRPRIRLMRPHIQPIHLHHTATEPMAVTRAIRPPGMATIMAMAMVTRPARDIE